MTVVPNDVSLAQPGLGLVSCGLGNNNE